MSPAAAPCTGCPPPTLPVFPTAAPCTCCCPQPCPCPLLLPLALVVAPNPARVPCCCPWQVFFLLRESELTPSGSNLLDGRFAVFGYVTEGQDFLGVMKVGGWRHRSGYSRWGHAPRSPVDDPRLTRGRPPPAIWPPSPSYASWACAVSFRRWGTRLSTSRWWTGQTT